MNKTIFYVRIALTLLSYFFMKKLNNTTFWFTLVELIVSLTIFSMIILIAFNQFPYLVKSIKKANNQKQTIEQSISLKEEFQRGWNYIAFYDYQTLNEQIQSEYDFENRFRRNIKDLIEDSIDSIYSLPNYSLWDPDSCERKYSEEQVFSQLETDLIDEVFYTWTCDNKITTEEFKENFKILTIVSPKDKRVTVFLVYKSYLHKIVTQLNTNLDNDDIIYHKIATDDISVKIYDNFLVNKLYWESWNKCLDNNYECIFTDFSSKQDKSWTLNLGIFKLTDDGYEIDFSTSYYLDTIFTINS